MRSAIPWETRPGRHPGWTDRRVALRPSYTAAGPRSAPRFVRELDRRDVPSSSAALAQKPAQDSPDRPEAGRGPICAETRQRLLKPSAGAFGGQGSECAHRRPTRMRRTARPFLCELLRAGREPTEHPLDAGRQHSDAAPVEPPAACPENGQTVKRVGRHSGPPHQSNRYGASVRIEERKRPRLRTPVVGLSVV